MGNSNFTSAAFAVAAIALTGAIIAVGREGRQEWKLKPGDSPETARFSVERRKPGSRWSGSSEVPWRRFRGLPSDPFAHGGLLRFEYVTDAGRLICKGDFSWSKGEGTYTFTPNAYFSAELKRLGYSAPDREQLFAMTVLDIGLDFARAVAEAGLHATTSQLVELRARGVSLPFIREVRDAGYENFSAQDYLQLRIHGVTTQFLRDLKAYGYDLRANEVADLRIHGVTSDFVRELRDAGYDVTAKQITELRIHGVGSDYLRELKNYGVQPYPSDLTQLRIHGVTPEYLRALKEAGYGNLLASEIAELRMRGVSPEFIQDAKSLGYDFTPRELMELRTHGVDSAYLQRLRDAGMKNLRAADIEKLKIHGVD